MKKLILAVGLLAMSIAPSYAHMHNTRCGRAVQTVSRDFFPTDQEYQDFCAELDEIYC